MKVSLLTRLTLAVSWKSVPRLAGVAELVDAPDSKSGFLWKWEFESPRPHHFKCYHMI